MHAVEIREFFLDVDGELKKGKKGITLNGNEWGELVRSTPWIEARIAELEEEKQQGGAGPRQ